jgi:hypothetical protein
MANLNELREQRGKLIADARKILDTAEEEKRELSAEEPDSFDRLMDEPCNAAPCQIAIHMSGVAHGPVRLYLSPRGAYERKRAT